MARLSRPSWVALGAPVAAALAGAFVAASQGCVAFVCFEGDPCSHASSTTGAGGSSPTGSSTTATVAPTTSTSTTSTGNTGTTTSTGTSGACPDPKNCGAPGIDCLGGACTNCICEPVALDMGGPVGRVAVAGPSVYVAAKGATGNALYSVPQKFTPGMSLTGSVLTSLPDITGFVAASLTSGIAYAPATDPHLTLCSGTTCMPTTQTFSSNVNGMTFDPSGFYFAIGGNGGGIASYKPFSVPPPSGAPNGLPLLQDDVAGNPDVLHALNGSLYWTDASGCLRVFSESLAGTVKCASVAGVTVQATDLSVNGLGIFVVQTNGDLYELAIDAASQSGSGTLVKDDAGVAIKATAPISADGSFVYVSAQNGVVVYKYLPAGSPLVASLSTTAAIVGIDTSDPQYVFFTAGQKLYRWTKPKP